MAVHLAITLVAFYLTSNSLAAKEKAYYLSTERVNVTYWNPRHLGFLNVTTKRYGRRDPKYYLNASVQTLGIADNNLTVDFWFYEYRSNEYRRGFVEMHFRWCELVLKDFFFGPSLRASGLTCPMPKGTYHLVNCTVPELPLLRTFPFRKGRIYAVMTGSRDVIIKAYVDIEIKQMTRPTK